MDNYRSDNSFEEDILSVMDDELSRQIDERGEEIALSRTEPAPAKMVPSNSKGHRARVRDRFFETGLEGFAPHEILEMLLFYALPRRDTKPVAYALLRKFGSIAGVFDAPVSRLCEVEGITENAAMLFKLIPPLIGVYYTEEQRGTVYSTTASLCTLFRPYFVGCGGSKFTFACFDSSLRLLRIADVSSGTSVEMKKMLSMVLDTGCAMCALAHNHPGASPNPSEDDIVLTRKISAVLSAVDVSLMDHIIIGSSSVYSMRDGGDLTLFD